jgi:ATP-dependent Clp protease adaptor protein ClpS
MLTNFPPRPSQQELGFAPIRNSSPQVTSISQILSDTSLDNPLQVIVHDDPVNLMGYVVIVFKKVFPSWSIEYCKKKMLEVHNNGQSVVFIGPRTQSLSIASTLQSYQLWVTIQT